MRAHQMKVNISHAWFLNYRYGRVTVHNASHLSFEYLLNKNGSVVDSWTLVQEQHGPFA